jgi:diguanylate cyclase (GGDEF)-like protein
MLEDIIKENKEINQKLENDNNQLRNLALIDELTGIANRRSFRNFIDLAYEALDKENINFSVIMIDIDYFKEYNDHYGHIEGDKILIAVANEINSVVSNPLEFVVRWGGEEFLYAAFNKSNRYVQGVAEIIRKKYLILKYPHKYSLANEYLSLSIGTYTTEIHNMSDVAHVIDVADKMMYRAKESGRNKIIKKEED